MTSENKKFVTQSHLTGFSAAVLAKINSLSNAIASATSIDDSVSSADTVYSSAETEAKIAAAKTELLGVSGAGFSEIQALMEEDDTNTAAILEAQSNRLAFDQSQSLTAEQQAQAMANMGITLSDIDFAEAFNAGLV